MSVTGDWSSAIAPSRPPVPLAQHWVMGLVVAAAVLTSLGLRYAGGAVPEEVTHETEAMVVALGAAAQRLEAPPEGVETAEEPSVVAERADDAPPPTAPPEPRKIAAFAQGDGRPSSGTGAGPVVSPPPPPRPAPPPPAPPPPAEPPPLDYNFIQRSQRIYMERIVYPAQSLRREEQGTGILRVEIDRKGTVLSTSFRRSTGFQRLDDEILRVAREVRKLDPLPAAYPADTAIADLSITFFLEYVDGGG